MKTLRLLALANAVQPTATALANVATLAIGQDGWAVIPYGDTTHCGANAEKANGYDEVKDKPVIIQRFTPARAEALANSFHSLFGRIKRAVVGLDVYKGHPDCEAFANIFRDKAPRGVIADMQARPDGLALKFVLNRQGAADVAAGWSHFSPYWHAEETGIEGKHRVLEPVRLNSIGLVGAPGSGLMRGNIPGLSLVNADPLSATMKNELIQLLALLGITVPPETAETPEAFAPFLATAKTTIADLKPKAELDKVEADKAKVEGELAVANARVTSLQGEHATALANARTQGETALKTFRTGAAGALVTVAIAAGRVPAAEREAQVTALANAADFTAAATALATMPAKLPTRSRLGDLGQTGKEQGGRQEQLLGLVNAHMATANCDYDTAWNAVTATEQGKALVGAMKRPEANA